MNAREFEAAMYRQTGMHKTEAEWHKHFDEMRERASQDPELIELIRYCREKGYLTDDSVA